MPDTILDDIAALKVANAQNTKLVADHEQRIAKLELAPASPPAPPPGPLTVTDAQLVQALRTLLLGGAAATGGTGGAGATAPAASAFTGQDVGGPSDTNSYPLAVPTVADGSDIVIGAGKNTFELLAASSPSAAADPNQVSHINIVFVRPDGTMQGVAADVPVTSFSGEGSPKQSIKVKGPWGNNPKFLLTAASKGSGMGGLFIGAANCDLAPLGISGQVNYAGSVVSGSPNVYISVASTTLTLMQTANQSSGGGSAQGGQAAATPTQINGSTLAQIAAMGPITLATGTIIGTAVLSADLKGAGMGMTTIDAAGIRISQDKAVLLAQEHVTISDVTIKGGQIASGLGANGAGVRDNGPGIGFDLENVEITGCQDGVLTFPSNVNLTNCSIHENGAPGTQRTHNIYIGGDPTTVAKLTGCTTWGCLDAHEVKSRAGTTISKGCHHITGGKGVAYEFPDAGKVDISDGTLTLPAAAADGDRRFLAYGWESVANAATGLDVTITNELFEDLTGNGGIIQAKDGIGAKLTLVGCTYKGPVAPSLTGWASVTGEISKAA